MPVHHDVAVKIIGDCRRILGRWSSEIHKGSAVRDQLSDVFKDKRTLATCATIDKIIGDRQCIRVR